MIVLGLDTAVGACSAAVLKGGRVLASLSEPMQRGHQERLALMVCEAMAEAQLDYAALDRIGVAVGPGSFTGLRVGLAFAKGLGAALAKPCVGIGTLEALAASEPGANLTLAVIDARRGQLYLQAFSHGRALMAPDVLPLETAAARLVELWSGGRVDIVGPGAELMEGVLQEARIVPRMAPDPAIIARLAEAKSPTPARPLYLRAPDAKLPGGLDPARLRVTPATVPDAPALAAIHAGAFEVAWTIKDLADLLRSPGVFALTAKSTGFILMRTVVDEAEILTLAVVHRHRRKGLGRILVQAGLDKAHAFGARTVFLEVAHDNDPALALYAQLGFEQAGRRARYYARGRERCADALILRKPPSRGDA